MQLGPVRYAVDGANYGEQLVERLSVDLTTRCGRGFGRRNLFLMRSFFVEHREIVQAAPAQLDVAGIVQALPAQSGLAARLAESFPLPWTHYVRLLAVRYETCQDLGFTVHDVWARKLFMAMLRKAGLEPFRMRGQRRTTIMVHGRKSLVELIWKEFLEANRRRSAGPDVG
ncbi:MAG: hypothetical protein AMXMBFR34_18520 [Myxococcaceae bacterium]